ncbi:uncharacterized protein TRUGW13939_02303 [Talaromyces rugulosus]|uniref:Uncharacterized protein n=1 Tax=Talaromyces rugulosus TaxID=121627 RepID=A0A7H8QP21_TALRU|nr:uncharacterized protein TRUGW13939_02303 [Talaromyces rugulosus]QKX55211.1 hypothetical protein TRUGW13939_02303 [Talaromyces rugulosus]
MLSGFTLENWKYMVYGIMLDTDRSGFGGKLQWVLNGMTMIEGSGNSATLTQPSGETFSCLVDMSKIGIKIFVLLASLVLVLVCLIAMDLYSLLRYWRDPTHARVRDIPLDYISWQLATVRSTDGNANLSEKDLGRFGYQWMDDKGTLDFQEVAPGDRNLLPLLAVETNSIAASKRCAE